MSEWYEHDGQSWPEHAHPDDWVEVRYRDGGTEQGRVDKFWRAHDIANLWLHRKKPSYSDIMAYRLAPPREDN